MSALKPQLQASLADLSAHTQPAFNLQPLTQSLISAIHQLITPLQEELNQEYKNLEETIKQGAGQLRVGSEEIEGRLEQLLRGLRDEAERQRSGVDQMKSVLETEISAEELERQVEMLEIETEKRVEEIREYEEKVIKAKVKLSEVKYENGQLTSTLTNLKLYPLPLDLQLSLRTTNSPPQFLPISTPLPASSTISPSFPLSLSTDHLYFAQVLWHNRPLSTQELVHF